MIACCPALDVNIEHLPPPSVAQGASALNVCIEVIRAILFDAAGTLFYLTKTVGDHYAYVGREVGLDLDAQQLERAFHAAWQQTPRRPAIDGPRENDDKGWWRELVGYVFDQVAPSLSELDRDNFFEVAYEHFAEAGAWKLYPEVPEVLDKLRLRFELAVISNFDARLRLILQHLGISKYFTHVFISSELGADKPDPEIFRRALKVMHLDANETLHVGDDPERDWKAAAAAGLLVFRLDRPRNSLRDLLIGSAGTRTRNQRLKRALLYRLSYRPAQGFTL